MWFNQDLFKWYEIFIPVNYKEASAGKIFCEVYRLGYW